MSKKVLWIVGGVVGLVLLTILLVPALVDANKFRPEIESRLSASAGRKVSLGTLSVGLFPPLTVKVHDVRIEDPTLPPGTYLMEAPLLELHIDPWAYAQGRVEISSLAVNRPNLIVGPSVLKKSAEEARPTTFSSKPDGAAQVRVGRIHIEGMSLSLFQEGGNPSEPDFRLENADVSIPGYDSSNPFAIETARADVDLAGARLAIQQLQQPVQFQSGVARIDGNRFSLDDMKASIDGTSVDGKVSATPLKKPAVTFQLHFSELSSAKLQSWMKPRTVVGSGAAGGSSSTEAANAAPPVDGSIRIDRFLFGTLAAENVDAKIFLSGNDLRIDKLNSRVCEGATETRGTVKLGGREPVYTLNTKVRGLNLALLLKDKAGKRSLMSGKLDMDSDITGTGMQMSADGGLGNMRGSGHFSIGEGTFSTLNLLEHVRLLSIVPGLKTGEGSSTPFDSVSADFRFDGRRVQTDRMEMRTGPLNLVLSGYFTLARDLDFIARASGSASSQGNSLVGAILGTVARSLNLSFHIYGTLEHPQIKSN